MVSQYHILSSILLHDSKENFSIHHSTAQLFIEPSKGVNAVLNCYYDPFIEQVWIESILIQGLRFLVIFFEGC